MAPNPRSDNNTVPNVSVPVSSGMSLDKLVDDVVLDSVEISFRGTSPLKPI